MKRKSSCGVNPKQKLFAQWTFRIIDRIWSNPSANCVGVQVQPVGRLQSPDSNWFQSRSKYNFKLVSPVSPVSPFTSNLKFHDMFMHSYKLCVYIYICVFEGSLEVKLPTIWTDEKQRWEESAKRREERRSKKRKSQKKEVPGARKGRKVAKHCVFPMICGSGGSKSRLAKAAGAEPAGQLRDEKLRAFEARSTFPSQNEQNTSASEHF